MKAKITMNPRVITTMLLRYALAGLCLAASPVQAAFVGNGSFESPNIGPAGVLMITAGNEPAGFGWTVTTGSVDVVRNGFAGSLATAYDGTQVLDLVGTGNIGGISLLLPTTAGTQYALSFAYANNPFAGLSTASATVSLHDGATPLFLDSIAHDTSTTLDFKWAIFDRVFTGTGNPVTLAFDNTIPITGGHGGILLDAISLAPVPIPAAVWLFGTGLAALSLGFRRSTRDSKQQVNM